MQLTWARRFITLLLLCLLATPAMAAPVFAQAMVSPGANIASRLGSVDDAIVAVYDYTQLTDPEGLLGLPGAYTSKAYFRDSYGIEGLVEVFTTNGDARLRKATLDQAQLGVDPSVAEYVIAVGPVVLRLFGTTDVQQYAYYQRLTRLLRVP
jgi:hypothetical protein